MPVYILSGGSHIGAGTRTALPLPYPRHVQPAVSVGATLVVARLHRVRRLPRRSSSRTTFPLPSSSQMQEPMPPSVGTTPVVARLHRVRRLPRRGSSRTTFPLPSSSQMQEPLPPSVGATLVVARLHRVRRLPRRGSSRTTFPLPLSSRMRGPIPPSVFPVEQPTPVSVGAPCRRPPYPFSREEPDPFPSVGAGFKPALPHSPSNPISVGATLVVAHLRRVRRLPHTGVRDPPSPSPCPLQTLPNHRPSRGGTFETSPPLSTSRPTCRLRRGNPCGCPSTSCSATPT